ncbi:MAG TPA: alpha/beta fold hydrolase, partial [Candidatus Dormibacteraeota bacterium]|nr:alpha/beta fold hydrolase [Candidatus Dormibacteraeota bacterium]
MRTVNLRRLLVAGAAVLVLAAASEGGRAAALAAGEGFIQVPGGPVWYRVFGSGSNTPLLMLHGGPGGSSCNFEPLATLVSAHRPVVVYDQLGGGRSGRPMDRNLWTLERSLEEVAAVRHSLGLGAIHLMGSSWGAALAADYAIKTDSRGLRSLI